eukprot:scaffold8602_cov196-Amphora_coffeaeformis.AAC.6
MTTFLQDIVFSSPWSIAGSLAAALGINSAIQWLLRPKNQPPFYYEHPYIPWLGSLVQFATQPREFLTRAAAKCGNVFTIQLFGRKMTFLMGTEGHAHFFRAKEDVFDIREAYAMTVTTFGPGVCYDVPQSRMAEQFSFFKDGLSDKAFVKYMDYVQEEVQKYFFQTWGNDEGQARGACWAKKFVSDGTNRAWPNTTLPWIIRLGESTPGRERSFIFPFPNPHRTKCIQARQVFERIFTEVMNERIERAKNDKSYTPPRDFLQDLMEATYKDGTKPSSTEITGILIGVLLGGQHTSNVTGTWILVHLLKNKEWYDKVMKEQEEIFGKKKQSLLSPSTLTFDDVQHMPVFEQVFMEVLRLHHPFFQLSRSVKQDSVFNDTVIPRGHFVNVAPSAAMRMPELFPDGDKFDPSRFAPERKNEIKPYAFIGFGGGMHQCGGRKFAWNSLKASISWLLRNYEMELIGKGATSYPSEDYTTMVVAPTKAHVQVRYKRRK